MYLCPFFHFFCILVHSLCDLCTAEKSREFLDGILTFKRMDLRDRLRTPLVLLYLKMRVRHRSDLWQMCDAEYLMMSSYDRHLL